MMHGEGYSATPPALPKVLLDLITKSITQTQSKGCSNTKKPTSFQELQGHENQRKI